MLRHLPWAHIKEARWCRPGHLRQVQAWGSGVGQRGSGLELPRRVIRTRVVPPYLGHRPQNAESSLQHPSRLSENPPPSRRQNTEPIE